MTSRAAFAFAAIICAFSPGLSHAGPCSNELYQADVAINKQLDAIAAKGKAAPQSSFATTHHQPTPATIAGAEETLGDISESDVKAVREFMAEAKKADQAGDKTACDNALAAARKLMGM